MLSQSPGLARRAHVRLAIAVAVVLVALGIDRTTVAAECLPTDTSTLPATIRMQELGELLGTRIDACATETRADDAARFWESHHLEATAARMRDYVRIRTVFEMTRDGGPWRLRWAITNQEPSAKMIWSEWRSHPPMTASASPSATAECDEISALFAGLSRRVGVRGVGLFWPTRDHTIAAWEPAPGVRVLVPTTQIYSSCEDTFDRSSFSPTVQKRVFELSPDDVPAATPIPRALAVFLLDQVTHYAGASLDVLAMLRLHRALALASSVKASCLEGVTHTAKRLHRTSLSARDRAALVRYGVTELGLTAPSAEEVLDHVERSR